ncbi:MAG: S-methyl-5-thioribose-1-phosphate isomerase [Firmicutes bacterium]|nr:S-methyl-5-thioribose-1-phosphate isomerase [Bacillota bacterium]
MASIVTKGEKGVQPIWWEEGKVVLIDQSKLPHRQENITCSTYQEVGDAIREMRVRGAPAIGVAAAFGFVLAAREYENLPAGLFSQKLRKVATFLSATRPTAVNLFWALRKMQMVVAEYIGDDPHIITNELEKAALKLAEEDRDNNRRIGELGLSLVCPNARILTHCNAGALATAGYGTALGVIRAAQGAGRLERVYVDETRPLLQGARLTAYELVKEGIPVTLITDNMAGYVLQQGMVDLVMVGADRIAANGDVANKIGTYSLAVLAWVNNIPFYVVAPTSSFDFQLATGAHIPIEEREAHEVTHFLGQSTAPAGVDVFNPSFDITQAEYITAIITEVGILAPPLKVGIEKLGEVVAGE